MTVKKAGRHILRLLDRGTDIAMELALCAALLFALYSLWDSRQIYRAAEPANYAAYRPESGGELSFETLRERNPEVFAWLTVNDTPIDYPVAQGENNEKYVNTNAAGEYSLSGSLFLDARNSPDFSDFNSIIYGHHMEKGLMFGALSDFADPAYFEAHPYGNLFFEGQEHGLEFFALLLTDAYDKSVFTPALRGEEERAAYIENLRSLAVLAREISVAPEDRLVLLSTCTTSLTNGRYVLVGRLSAETYPQQREETAPHVRIGTGADRLEHNEVPLWVWLVMAALLLLLPGVLRLAQAAKRKRRKEEDKA